jgi:hypothetical protein
LDDARRRFMLHVHEGEEPVEPVVAEQEHEKEQEKAG